MGARFRGVAVVMVVLVVGAFAGSALAQWWAAGPTPEGVPAFPGRSPTVRERVRVEVLNGGGREGMARTATESLRDDGFDVVYFGNAPGEHRDSSQVLARSDQVEFARAVADALGIRHVEVEPDSNLYLDVTVVLGDEWEPRVDPDAGHNVDATPWWDVRRFFKRRPGTLPAGGERLVDPGTDNGGS